MSKQTVPEPPSESMVDELVPVDDRVIGRAFRRSLLVLALIGASILVYQFGFKRKPAPEAVLHKDVGRIESLPRATEIASPRFRDVTVESGITFIPENGATGDKWLPEAMGTGCAFFDYDGDGDQDLFLVNARGWTETSGPAPVQALYRNDGTGRFDDVTEQAGLAVTLYGTGVAAADYDGDGDVDLFLAALGSNRLFRNDAGRFTDVTEQAGVAGAAESWSTSAGFFDADGDQDLDLFVCNYVVWSKEVDRQVNYTLDGTHRAYGPPMNYHGTFPYFYRNRGDGTFEESSEQAGLHVTNSATGAPVAKSLALSIADLDEDGRLDLVVANDTTRNFLFRNLGDGRFEELGVTAGLAFDNAGNATGAMGIDTGRYRNDGSLGIGIGNFANEMSSFFVAQGGTLLFSDDAAIEGLGSPTRARLSFGLFFFDYDLDGWLDLLQANGHLEEEIETIQPSQSYRQPAQLFWNQGAAARACFVEVPIERAGDLATPIVGRAAGYADIDGDGDLDVLLTQIGASPLLLRNEQELGHAWVRVKLAGRAPNTGAIGARLILRAGGLVQERAVMPTRSYLSQVELPVTFGLGENEQVDALEIVWPDGMKQRVGEVPLFRTLVVEEPR